MIWDVVVIGGGVIGSFTSYFLRQLGVKRVCVVERDFRYRAASTVLSAGGIRQQFSLRENIELSLASLNLMKETHLEGESLLDRVGFVPEGYCFLTNSSSGAEVLKRNVAVQNSLGARIDILDRDALRKELPHLQVDDIHLATLGRHSEGWFDPHSLLLSAKALGKSAGVEFIEGDAVRLQTKTSNEGSPIVGLRDGRELRCGHVVVAAGAWSGMVAKLAGLSLPVEPRVRAIYAIHAPAMKDTASQKCPLTVDPSGVYFRREGTRGSCKFICGLSPDEEEDITLQENTTEDVVNRLQNLTSRAFFEERIWPVLASRAPGFEELKVISSWAGCYDVNTLDDNAIISRHPTDPNLSLCTGFSGHGLQMSPAAGRATAELVVHGKSSSIHLDAFGLDRVFRNDPIREANIV